MSRTAIFFPPVTLLLLILSIQPTRASQNEITHLLDFIEHSNCIFVRNGKSHTAPETRNHITRKYNHIKKRISTTEEFIRHTATRSSITSKNYTVICDGKTMNSRAWLTDELTRFRHSGENDAEGN